MYYFIVRLAGGSTKYVGRVEVYHNSKWGRVCNNRWDFNEAQVVCRELGYGKATAAWHTSVTFSRYFYGHGVWLDDLKCVGTEWTIRNCLHTGWNVRNCRYYEVAAVKCATG